MTNEIELMIGQPKGERLEYQAILPTSKSMAEIICSFANSKGGYIVVGVSDNLEINGLSNDFRADSITDKAIGLLSPHPTIFLKYILFKGKKLYVIEVEKSDVLVRLEGKKYVRIGVETKLSDTTKLSFNTDGYIYQKKEPAANTKKQAEAISFHSYDINLKTSYVELEKQMQDIAKSKIGITKEEYLYRIKSGIESYCTYNNLGSLDSISPIILKYPAYNYHAHLAFQLMTFDINKISPMLDFQHENYTGLDEFQKIVEHGVYDWIKHNSPFDNEARLQKIMEWVEKKKGVIHSKNKVAKLIGDKILEEFKKSNADVGHIVMLGVVQQLYNKLTPPDKKEFNNVFNGMVADGFIGYDKGEPDFIRLGDKGHTRIYKETTISESQSTNELPVVVILTAIKEEYAAVRSHLDSESINVIKKDSILYEQGVFKHDGRNVAKVIIKACGPKNANTAQETQRAISSFRPHYILFVGIAGSRKPQDFGLGDVIFPENVHYYEGGKSELNSFNARPDDVKPTHALCDIVRIEQHKEDWKALIKGKLEKEVSLGLGVIASGEKVVEHYDSTVGKIISAHYGDAACVAMEEYGFLSAVHRQGVEYATMMAGVVRGVSDILEREGAENTIENEQDRRPAEARKFASNTAAAFAYWLIIKAIELKVKYTRLD